MDFILCELCYTYVPECEKCHDGCEYCHDTYGCDEELI